MSHLTKKSEPFKTIQSNFDRKYQLLTPPSNYYPATGRVEVGCQKKQFESYQPSRKNSMSNLTSGINKIGIQSRELEKESRKETISKISSSKHKLKQILETNYIKIEDKKKLELDRIHLKIIQCRPELGNKPTQQLLDIILKPKPQKSQVKSNNNSIAQYESKIRYLQEINQQKDIQVKNVRQQLDSMMKIMDSNKELLDRLREQIKLKTETYQRTQKQLLKERQAVKQLTEKNNQSVMQLTQIGYKVQRLQEKVGKHQQKQENIGQLKLQLQQLNRRIQEKNQKQIEMQKIVKQCQQVSNQCVAETLKGLEMEKNNLTQISMRLHIKNEQYEERNKILQYRQRILAEKQSELQQLVMRMQKSEFCLENNIGELQKTMDQTQKGERQSFFENNFYECERDFVEIRRQLAKLEECVKQSGKDNIEEKKVIQLNKKLQSLMQQYQLRIQQMEKKLNLTSPKKQTF